MSQGSAALSDMLADLAALHDEIRQSFGVPAGLLGTPSRALSYAQERALIARYKAKG